MRTKLTYKINLAAKDVNLYNSRKFTSLQIITMLKYHKKACAFALSGLITSAAFAAEKRTAIDEIIVSASPIAETAASAMRSVTVISHEQIAATSATNLADLLAKEGAITISRRGAPGTQADVGIRGSHFEQTLVLLNGVPIQSPQTGHNNLNIPIPPAHIECIEIIKGPGAIQYGGSTTGGVINIITRQGDEKEQSGSLELGYGSHQTQSISLSAAQRSDALTQRISIKATRSDSERKSQPNDIKMYDALYTGESGNGPVKVHWGLGSEKKDFGAWGFYSDVFPDARERVTTRMAWTGIEINEGRWRGNADVYWRDYKDWFLTTIAGNRYINRHKTEVYGLKGSLQEEDATGITAIGGHFRKEEIHSNALNDHKRKQNTAWITRRQHLSDSWRLDIGLTAARYSQYGSYWLPSAALAWQFSSGWHSFLSAARSMRAPSYTELFMNTAANQGNALLRPEKFDSYELGFVGRPGDHQFKSAIFERRSQTLIDWNRSSGSNAYQANNFDKYRIHGLESSWRWQANLPGLESLTIDWQWLATKLKEKKDVTYTRQIPSHSLLINWRSKIVESTHISATARRPHYKNQKNATLLDVKLDWQIDRWTLAIEGHNLLNKRIIETGFAPIAGRWYYLSAKMDF